MTFEGDLTCTKHLQISNQNALLSLMSHDDLEDIKDKIFTRINKIEEAKDEEREDEEG